MSERITCVIADDHPAMLTAIADTLERSGVEIVGRASDGQEALAQIEAQHPRVAIVDVRMPRLSGIEVAQKAAVVAPNTSIIFYTAYGDRALLSEALDVGARGFVLKEAPLPDLVRAVERVAAGEAYVDPVLAGVLVSAQSEKIPVADPAGARGPAPARGRPLERGDRQAALHLAGDRADARAQGDGEARGRHADAGRRRWRCVSP